MLHFKVNGKERQVDVEEDTPLLWVLRDNLDLPGTKFGCGVAECGACTVHVDGEAVRSCSFPVSDAVGKNITTIEGLDALSKHPLQQAWVKHEVPQCGYCQSGMIMSAAALLQENPSPSDEEINEGVTNVCRCGTYSRVRAAIHTAAGNDKGGN